MIPLNTTAVKPVSAAALQWFPLDQNPWQAPAITVNIIITIMDLIPLEDSRKNKEMGRGCVCIYSENNDQTFGVGTANEGSGGNEIIKEEGGKLAWRSAGWYEWWECREQDNVPPFPAREPAAKMWLYMAKGTTDILGKKSKRISIF